jgi:3'-phosphoadenosine 5'-phosphosulfate sulfotransferase (PAPS reductase)/FAD synthetase
MNDLNFCREIIIQAQTEFKPQATVFMFSGGDDSLTTGHVAKELGIKFDFIIHGNTRTGIEETTEFARKESEKFDAKYLEADAGDSYVNYVMRKGFFGKGLGAHAFTYHILKQDHFERVVAKHIRQRRRNFKILFVNGARRTESENRLITMASPFKVTKRRPNDMWVNLINEFTKEDCRNYLDGNSIDRNPVSVNLCRSGECMCGTMQSQGDRNEAGFFYPGWKKWIDELEKEVKAKHGWGWNENKPKQKTIIKDTFQPMCTGCKINAA